MCFIQYTQTMEFCTKCDNMYYMKVNDDNKLIYHCKYCGNEDAEAINTQNLKVYKFTKESKKKDIHINEFTKYDPTLPHSSNIKCPNTQCKSNDEAQSVPQKVIYLRYDDTSMKYTYLCYHCNHNWVP